MNRDYERRRDLLLLHADSPPPPWTPAALGATVEARWESDAGITLTSGRVSGWNDLKNAHHLAQSNAANRPVVEDAVFGTSKGVRFTAANSEILLLSGGALISTPTAAHAFLVLKLVNDPPSVNTSAGMWRFGQGTQTSAPFTDGTIYDNFASSARKTTGNPVASMAAPCCYEVVSTASEWTNRLNGTQIYTTATNAVAWIGSTQALGGEPTVNWLDGWVGALIICNAKLTGSDLTSMRGYLASKYGVTFA